MDTGRYRLGHGLRSPLRATSLWLLAVAALTSVPAVAKAVPSCSATVATGLVFGTYDVFSPVALTSTARMRLNCPKGQTPQVTISSGNSGTFVWRELRSPSDRLRYNVYLDAAMTVIWGDGTDGSQAWVSPGGNAQLLIYGLIPPGQDAIAGDYADVLTVTVFL
jgi:spore coat protein U-like protein